MNNQDPWAALERIAALYERARPTPGDIPNQIAKTALAAREESPSDGDLREWRVKNYGEAGWHEISAYAPPGEEGETVIVVPKSQVAAREEPTKAQENARKAIAGVARSKPEEPDATEREAMERFRRGRYGEGAPEVTAFCAGYREAMAMRKTAEKVVWTCTSCGHIGEGQSCRDCGREAMPGRWLAAREDTERPAGKWDGVNDGDPWRLEVEIDCMSPLEPFTVSVWVGDAPGQTKGDVEGAFLSSAEAREVAATLVSAANGVDRNNTRVEVQERVRDTEQPDDAVRRNWRCKRCASGLWVAISLDGGATRLHQCVPCGAVGDPVRDTER